MASPSLKKTQGNSASTTLSSGVASGDTSAPLTADTNFAGEGMVVISEGENVEEFAYATAKAGGALTIPLANRGEEGGSAQTHASGATVKGILTAGMWNDLIDQMQAGAIDTNENEVITYGETASAVNEITVTNAATTTSPSITATGGDTNIDVKIAGKGTGHLQAYDNTSASYFDVVPNSSMARQAIMNGNFDVWQRGVSFTPTTGDYMADRWQVSFTLDSGTLPTDTFTRAAITPGDLTNSFYSLRLTVNGAGSSFGASAYYRIGQRIEHGTRNLCGDGKKVTVSFWAKSDIADKKIAIRIAQNYGTGGSPTSAEYLLGTSFTLTSTWTKYTHTFTTNTLASKTFGTANDDYLELGIFQMWGATYGDTYIFDGAEAEDFGGAGYIDIAQVQLCAGEVALPFQPKSYAQELADCQRYYEKSYNHDEAPGTNTAAGSYVLSTKAATTASTMAVSIPFKVKKRTAPTVATFRRDGSATNPTYWRLDISGYHPVAVTGECEHFFYVSVSGSSGLTAGVAYMLDGHWTASAEL